MEIEKRGGFESCTRAVYDIPELETRFQKIFVPIFVRSLLRSWFSQHLGQSPKIPDPCKPEEAVQLRMGNAREVSVICLQLTLSP